MPTAYKNIAHIYDVFVKADFDIPFFLTEVKKTEGEILELMVGTGRVTLPLVEAGAKITGIDNSPEMLDQLRRKLQRRELQADIREMDVRRLELDKMFDVVLIPFHAFPEVTDEADQMQVLTTIRDHLTDDGHLIVTLHNPPVRLKSVEDTPRLIGKFPRAEDGHLLVWLLQKYDPENDLMEVDEFFEEYDNSGLMIGKRWTTIQFHLMEKSVFESRYQAAGFEPVALYGDYDYSDFDEETSPAMIWVLRKTR